MKMEENRAAGEHFLVSEKLEHDHGTGEAKTAGLTVREVSRLPAPNGQNGPFNILRHCHCLPASKMSHVLCSRYHLEPWRGEVPCAIQVIPRGELPYLCE